MAWTNILGQSRVGIRTGVLTQQVSYLLDTYSGAAAAYSLRKLNGSYTGSAIRVRRSSDNAETNIGFDSNGNLDTSSMLSFVGYDNSAQYSEEFDNVYWTKNVTTVTSNQTTAPDGTMTADLFSEAGTSNSHSLISPNGGLPIGTSWNISVYVKKGPGTSAPDTFMLGFLGSGASLSSPFVLFNISSGTVVDSINQTNDANFGSSIVDAGNGWWRCSTWGTVTVGRNCPSVGVIRFNNNLNTINLNNYAGNVQANMYIWGYQFSKALNDTSVLTTKPYTKTTNLTAGNGFVTTWYDQSSTYDAAQTTSSKQPQIVSSGNLLTQNSKPTIKFDGSDDFLLTGTYSFTSTDKLYGAYVSTTEVSNASSMVVGQYKQFSTAVYLLGYTSTSYTWVTTRNLANTTAYSYAYGPYAINTQYLSEAQLDLSNTTSVLKTKSWRNNVLEVMTTNGGAVTSLPTFAQPISIGADTIGTTFKLKGNIQEIVLYYNQDKTNDRSGIASNINNYYNIYTPTTPSLSTGLFGIWNGNGNTNDSYSTLTGEARGGLTYSIGKNGSAFTFNGSNTTMVAFPVNSWTTGDNFSFSLWFNVNSLTTASQALISNYGYTNSPVSYFGWGLRVSTAGLTFQRLVGTGAIEEYSSGTVTANQWYHVVITRNGSVTKVYLNGDLVGGKYSNVATAYSNTVPRIGLRMDTATTNAVWQVTNGSKIDEVYLWNKALTDVEVKELYNSGNGKFYPFN
jgi:hypothetical protein